MKNYCYICGRELSDIESDTTAKRHKEHIIHNGIYGRLKSSTILCERCGGAYSKSDAKFVELFSGFIELLNDKLYSKDHGSNKRKRLKAYLNPNNGEQQEVEYYMGKTYPNNPYYVIDEEKKELILYANGNRLKGYEKVILKEHPEYTTYRRILKDDVTDRSPIGLFFSENNLDFNRVFEEGLAKIATEFAIHSGVNREDIPTTLKVKINGECVFDATDTPIIPYSPQSSTEMLTALVEDIVDDNYPSHVLRLYVDETSDYRMLVCYVDLFSTFRYYVILNTQYTGEKVSKDYAQRIISINDKDGKQLCPEYDLEEALKKNCKNLMQIISDYYSKSILPDYIDKLSFIKLLESLVSEEGMEQVSKEIINFLNINNYSKNVVWYYDDAPPTVKSLAGLSLDVAEGSIEQVREYTMYKFNQLDRYCWNIDKLGKSKYSNML